MLETADQSATVTLNVRPLSLGHGELPAALRGWYITLCELAGRPREALSQGGHLIVETVAARDAVTECARPARAGWLSRSPRSVLRCAPPTDACQAQL